MDNREEILQNKC